MADTSAAAAAPTAPTAPAQIRIILASTSRYRRELLMRLGFEFATADPALGEEPLPGEAPRERAVRLAVAKARAVAARHPQALVIGSDQVCESRGRVLDKPGTLQANREMLLGLSRGTALFHTAVAVVRGQPALLLQHVDATRCDFRALGAAEVDAHLQREPALDCAGGFKAEGLGIALCERIESSDPTALIGLPLIWLAAALRGQLVDHPREV